MVLKKSFLSDINEALAVYIHCSGLLGDRAFEPFSWETALSQYDSSNGKKF